MLAVLMTFSMVLAGCMDLTDEDVESIVDSLVDLPGCNDETAYNYDENATNNLACLTEQVLKQSVTDFVNLVDNGPAWNETMGMMMEGSETDSDGMTTTFTTTMAVSPDGMYLMTEMDMGMMVIEIGELMTENADGTTNIQTTWMGNTFQMNTEAVFDDHWNEQSFLEDDDDYDEDHSDEMICYDMDTHTVLTEIGNQADCENGGYMWVPANSGPGGDDSHDGDHGDDMGDDDMDLGLPDTDVEIPDDFDPATALYTAGLSTSNGYSFTTTLEHEGDYTTTMTFTLSSDLAVTSLVMVESYDGMTSTSSITILDAEAADQLLVNDETLVEHALPFTLSPLGGDDHGDHDEHDGDHNGDHDGHDHGDGDGDHDDDDDLITPEQLLADIDSDESGTMSLDEFNAFFGGSEEIDVNDPEFSEIFDNNDADASGDLDSYELEGFIMELDAYLEGGHDDNGHDEGGHDDHDDDNDDDMMSETDMWAVIDADGDGYATVSDIVNGFNSMGAPTPEQAMEDSDTDNSGGVSWDEFVAEWNSEEDEGSDEHLDNNATLASDLHTAFNSSDVDNDGNLSIDELGSFIDQVVSLTNNEEDTAEMTEFIQMFVNCVDTDDDGLLDEMEFSEFYMRLNEELGMAFCMFDTDGDGLVSASEYAAFVNDSEDGAEPMTEDEWQMFVELIDIYDLDANGGLDAYEFDDLMMDMSDENVDDGSDAVSWEPYHGGYCEWEGNPDDEQDVWSCKDDASDLDWGTWWYYCELHGEDWYCTDDYGQDSEYEYSAGNTNYDHNGHDDHDGHDDDGHDDHMMAYDWMINTADMMSETEVIGAYADYHIVLANCVSESSDDMMGGETLSCGDDVLKVTIAEATAPGAEIMFHDADMSGTITAGDMIHINPDIDAGGEWNTVRLYSVDADKYSDENPMMTPGFGAFAGIVALLGAALLTRRD